MIKSGHLFRDYSHLTWSLSRPAWDRLMKGVSTLQKGNPNGLTKKGKVRKRQFGTAALPDRDPITQQYIKDTNAVKQKGKAKQVDSTVASEDEQEEDKSLQHPGKARKQNDHGILKTAKELIDGIILKINKDPARRMGARIGPVLLTA